VFNDLRVVGIGARSSLQPTMGSLFSPSSILRKISEARHPPVRDILSGFEGVVAPGEMLREHFRISQHVHYETFSSSRSRQAWVGM
jgi:hypothetical protein